MNPDQQLNRLLNRYADAKVKIRKERKRVALDSWESKVQRIIEKVSSYDSRFKFEELFRTGSFYDRLKVKEPNEFDLTLIMKGLELGADPPYDGQEERDGLQGDPPIGFTTVMIDRGEQHDWNKGKDIWVKSHGLLDAVTVKAVFARHVSRAIQELGYQRSITQTSEGPALTLKIKKTQSTEYSVDLALAIRDSSWPEDAAEWPTRARQGWPKQELVKDIKQSGCFLVAKQPKAASTTEPFFWYYSFTHAEKMLFREGAHGEPNSCRKQVLRIMKALREDLRLTALKSYHLKTIMLYEYESKPRQQQWSSDQVGNRFKDAMIRLLQCLERKNCPHYFMRELNLFQHMSEQSRQDLSRQVRNILSDPQRNIIP